MMHWPQLRKILLLFIHYKEQIQEHQMIVQDMMQDNTEHPTKYLSLLQNHVNTAKFLVLCLVVEQREVNKTTLRILQPLGLELYSCSCRFLLLWTVSLCSDHTITFHIRKQSKPVSNKEVKVRVKTQMTTDRNSYKEQIEQPCL